MAEIGTTLIAADYIVVVVMLCVPLGIGAFYAVRDKKSATREEYLLGGRRMGLWPVTLSLFVTFQSAISLLGVPTEIYVYGCMLYIIYFGFASSFLISAFTFVPLMYPLRLTSMFEYLELRFESRLLRKLCTVVSMLSVTLYMAVALLSPALALQSAANLPLWMSVAIVGVIGTVYTTIGGIKSVFWTDVFQAIIIFIGVFAIIVKGQ
ncbi:sodium-dependent multivitamin transporter-like [Aplysia californica]|uniref:Sodium-dependent multivitamin transporter-like n=1 Tax=Aplysia californica TaxID=6500 RepID=A0ABM1VW62_APLCA|nr:sodium-dependent multivitamin transporter-like [Aplysia californica]